MAGAAGLRAAALRGRARDRESARDELGRARAAVGGRNAGLPQRPQAGRPGQRPHSHSRGHRSGWPRRPLHRVRGGPEHTDRVRVREWRRGRGPDARLPAAEGHDGRRPRGCPGDDPHGLGHARHARGPEQPAVRLRQLALGRGRLLGVRGQRGRRAAAFRLRPVPLPARRLEARVRDQHHEQHVGSRLLRVVRRLPLDREQRAQRLRRDPGPVLR